MPTGLISNLDITIERQGLSTKIGNAASIPLIQQTTSPELNPIITMNSFYIDTANTTNELNYSIIFSKETGTREITINPDNNKTIIFILELFQ